MSFERHYYAIVAYFRRCYCRRFRHALRLSVFRASLCRHATPITTLLFATCRRHVYILRRLIIFAALAATPDACHIMPFSYDTGFIFHAYAIDTPYY